MSDRKNGALRKTARLEQLGPVAPCGVARGAGAIVLLVAGVLVHSVAEAQQQPQQPTRPPMHPANRTYPWQSDSDVVRLSDRFGYEIRGDERGPTLVVQRRFPDIRYERLTDRDLACLAKWSSLLHVVLVGDDLTAAALEYLRPCTKLESLHFGAADTHGFDGQDIKPLEQLKELRDLTLEGHRISLDGMKHIGRLARLDYLRLSGMAVTDEGLAYLGGLKRLEYLDLSETKVTAKGMKYLMPLKQLRDLGLLYTPIRESDVRELARSLPRLEISGDRWQVPSIGEEGDRWIADAYRAIPDLERLSRHNVRVKVRVKSVKEQRLGHLDMAKIMKGDGLTAEAVYTDDTDLNDRDLACLAKWELQRVTLAGKNLTAAVLHNLRLDSDLTSLSLRLVNRGFEARDIEPLEGKKYLSYLCLDGNSITAGAMERIGRLNLGVLDLSGCPVTDDDLIHLTGLERLWKLSLVGSKVTAAGLKHLTPLKELRSLDLTQTAVKKGDVEQLHRALPQLNIYGGTGSNTWEVEGASKKVK